MIHLIFRVCCRAVRALLGDGRPRQKHAQLLALSVRWATGTKPRLPPELEMDIFLLTARVHRGACVRLMLVAHRVKKWVEPVMYERVVLMYPELAYKFLESARKSRVSRIARTDVKSLYISRGTPDNITRKILTICSGCQSLFIPLGRDECRDPRKHIHFVLSLPVTFLSIHLDHITYPYHRPIFALRDTMSVRLTHLELVIYFDSCLRESLLEIENLPFLTHLACWYHAITYAHERLTHVLTKSQRLAIVILCTAPFNQSCARMSMVQLEDARVVVLGVDMGRHWQGELGDWDGEGKWIEAERIVRWRKDTGARPRAYPPPFDGV